MADSYATSSITNLFTAADDDSKLAVPYVFRISKSLSLDRAETSWQLDHMTSKCNTYRFDVRDQVYESRTRIRDIIHFIRSLHKQIL